MNDVSIIDDVKKGEVKNRTAFFVLMEKVGEMYLHGMFLSIMDHPNLLPLLDVLMFKGFPFLLKMALKTVHKSQAKAVKIVKTEIAQHNKLKVPVDTDVIKNIAEKAYSVYVTKMSNSDFNVNLKQTLEDKKLDTQVESKLESYLKLAQTEQVTNESQLNFNLRVHEFQALRQNFLEVKPENYSLSASMMSLSSMANMSRTQLMSKLQDPKGPFHFTP